jgi:hypothetical protein
LLPLDFLGRGSARCIELALQRSVRGLKVFHRPQPLASVRWACSSVASCSGTAAQGNLVAARGSLAASGWTVTGYRQSPQSAVGVLGSRWWRDCPDAPPRSSW